jgi:hypothetical protein
MTVTHTDHTTVRKMTDDELRAEIRRLLDRVGMTSDELHAKGAAYELDAAQRSVLADVEAMEWMLSRD